MTQATQQPPTKEQLDKALADAVRLGNVAHARELIEGYGCNPDARIAGVPLLMVAVKLKQPAMAALLLEKGATVNATCADGDSALMRAARLCKEDFMSLLLLQGGGLQQQNKAGETAESIALKGLAEAREAELKAHARSRTEAKQATDKWLKLALAMLATNPDPNASVDGHPAVTLAALMTTPDALQALLDRGADINAANTEGNTVLMLAAREYKPDFVTLLMERGADPMRANNDQETAAMIAMGTAIKLQAQETGGYDFQRKEKVAETDKWEAFALSLITPAAYNPAAEVHNSSLGMAICLKNLAAFELLLEKGADINKPDVAGNCALHAAAATGKGDIVDRLLDKGASILQQNKDKERPLNLFLYAQETLPRELEMQVDNKEIKQEEATATLAKWQKLREFLTVETDKALDALEAPLSQPMTVRNKPFKLKAKAPS